MLKTRQAFATLLKGILGGFCIGISSIFFLVVGSYNKLAGSVAFCVGLIVLMNLGYYLYTGKNVNFLNHLKRTNNLHYGIQLLIGLLGNIIGAGLFGLVLGQVFKHIEYIPTLDINTVVGNKLDNPLWVTFLLAMGCNVLIYFIVEAFAKVDNVIIRHLILILCNGGYIILGLEHSIANTFYLAFGGVFTLEAVIFLLVVILGNMAGGILIPSVIKLIKRLERR